MRKSSIKGWISIVLIILCTQAGFTNVFAGGDEHEITVDTVYDMWIGEDGETVMFSPESDGWYKFYTTGDCDTFATLYNSNWDEIAFSDDTNEDFDFYIKHKLYAGYTYYLDVGVYLSEEETIANFPLYTEETLGVEEVIITQEPYDTTVVEGYEYETFSCEGLEATFTFSDGSEVDWSYADDDSVADSEVYIYVNDDGYGHYYIDIICDDAFARCFFETVDNSYAYIRDHYLTGDVSAAYVYVPESGTYNVIFAKYNGTRLDAVDIVPLTTEAAGVFEVPSEEGLMLSATDKIMLWDDAESIIPKCEAYVIQ